MIFTVAELRDLADGGGFTDRDDRIRQALTTYADRLEQDEQTLKEGDIFTVENVYVVNPEFSERELGRREVYREILTISPLAEMGGNLYCVFCGSDAHAPDCLLERATAALRETTPTP